MKNHKETALKAKLKNLSVFDEHRVRVLEDLPTERIERKILKCVQGRADDKSTVKRR